MKHAINLIINTLIELLHNYLNENDNDELLRDVLIHLEKYKRPRVSSKLSGEFIVNNETDGFPASAEIFKRKVDAEAWIERFRASFKRSANEEFPDGFYKTSSCEYIHPNDIKLTIEELEEDL